MCKSVLMFHYKLVLIHHSHGLRPAAYLASKFTTECTYQRPCTQSVFTNHNHVCITCTATVPQICVHHNHIWSYPNTISLAQLSVCASSSDSSLEARQKKWQLTSVTHPSQSHLITAISYACVLPWSGRSPAGSYTSGPTRPRESMLGVCQRRHRALLPPWPSMQLAKLKMKIWEEQVAAWILQPEQGVTL